MNNDATSTRDSGLVERGGGRWSGGQSDELRDFIQFYKKENPALHTACATEKAAPAKSLQKGITLRSQKAA